ncbi:MAG: NAD(P)H-binding protein [Rhodopseudomonas sp.]|nr:NAD(P)H-binding protein [Rhodopseudomonas sp.]
MILVTGAAGKTGRAVIGELAVQGADVHAFIHRADQTGTVEEAGAAAVTVGDFDDAASLRRAMKDCEAIYHIGPNMSPHETAYAAAVIAAAQATDVKRLVYHSVLHPQIEAMPHHWLKMRIEEMLFASGLDVTVLQPAPYMQNLAAVWPTIRDKGLYPIPYPILTRLSLVDLDDVAEAASIVLTQDGHGGAVYELCGTAPINQREVADTLAEILGSRVRAQAEAPEVWEERARKAGMADDQRGMLVKMFRYYAAHGLGGNPNTLRWLLEREPTTLAEFIGRAAT